MINLLGVILTILGSLTLIPQSYHITKKKSTSGLSLDTILTGVITMIVWSIYTLSIKDLPAFSASFIPLLLWFYILLKYISIERTKIKKLRVFLLILAVLLLLQLTPLVKYFGILGVLLSSIWALPQLVKTIKESDFLGVSPITFLIITIENVLWIFYGVIVDNITYLIAPILQGPATFYITLKVFKSKSYK